MKAVKIYGITLNELDWKLKPKSIRKREQIGKWNMWA